jgi:hypothetical protein
LPMIDHRVGSTVPRLLVTVQGTNVVLWKGECARLEMLQPDGSRKKGSMPPTRLRTLGCPSVCTPTG